MEDRDLRRDGNTIAIGRSGSTLAAALGDRLDAVERLREDLLGLAPGVLVELDARAGEVGVALVQGAAGARLDQVVEQAGDALRRERALEVRRHGLERGLR